MDSRILSSLARPTESMSWVQLGALTMFVLTVAFAWRQVTHMIMDEI
jgi:hypothetical protein